MKELRNILMKEFATLQNMMIWCEGCVL
jgi:hypothetical protein